MSTTSTFAASGWVVLVPEAEPRREQRRARQHGDDGVVGDGEPVADRGVARRGQGGQPQRAGRR